MDEIFPSSDVYDCLTDRKLQLANRFDGCADEMEWERNEFVARGDSEQIVWIYFQSPAKTWELLCGRAGWLLLDPKTGEQLDFRLTVMN